MSQGGIYIYDMVNDKKISTDNNIAPTPRHIILDKDKKNYLVTSSFSGYLSKTDASSYIFNILNKSSNKWNTLSLGAAPRTIVEDHVNQIYWIALNGSSEIAAVDKNTFKILNKTKAQNFPVGIDVSLDGKTLLLTSQGKPGKGGGNTVSIFKILK